MLEGGQLVVASNHLERVSRKDAVVAVGYVEPPSGSQDAAHVDAVFLAQVELAKRHSRPLRVCGNLEVGNVDVAVEQTAFVEWAFVAMHLGFNVARPQVQDEEPFQLDAAMLNPPREDDCHQGHNADGDDDGTTKVGKVMADVEDESHGNDHANEDGEDERQVVDVALAPKGFEFF